jgi:hypothetical protein
MPGVTPDELARLQHQVLAAALGGPPLAGGTGLMLPDIQFARAGDEVVLSSANLAAGVRLDGLPASVRLAQPSEATRGQLEFTPARLEGDDLTLALEVRAQAPGGRGAIPLSSIALRFRRQDGGWTLAEPPAASAT